KVRGLGQGRGRTMVWEPEIDEMKRRRAFAEQMGGEAGIAEQRRRGKLTVRERIDLMTDAGSFQEIGQLAGAATYENGPRPPLQHDHRPW
ncbi:MAG: hypothetical protein J4F45_15305, partial [Pseudomonadales bacterium]|nr:hypothetical protein [Pseudomonadales bacterium]